MPIAWISLTFEDHNHKIASLHAILFLSHLTFYLIVLHWKGTLFFYLLMMIFALSINLKSLQVVLVRLVWIFFLFRLCLTVCFVLIDLTTIELFIQIENCAAPKYSVHWILNPQYQQRVLFAIVCACMVMALIVKPSQLQMIEFLLQNKRNDTPWCYQSNFFNCSLMRIILIQI